MLVTLTVLSMLAVNKRPSPLQLNATSRTAFWWIVTYSQCLESRELTYILTSERQISRSNNQININIVHPSQWVVLAFLQKLFFHLLQICKGFQWISRFLTEIYHVFIPYHPSLHYRKCHQQCKLLLPTMETWYLFKQILTL